MSATVSILIPCYNHARFIGACVECVISQSFQDWEMIIVDDRSTDDSLAFLQGLGDSRIKVYENEQNLGTYGSLERAVSLSSGEFVAILNSDDLWNSGKLETQLAILEQFPNAPFVFCSGFRIDEKGDPIEVSFAPQDRSADALQDVLPDLLERNDILASSVVFRRNAARFLPELRYSGDWVSLLSSARNYRVGYVDKPLAQWRIHANNTFKRSPAQVLEEVWVRESILCQPTFWEVARLGKREIRSGLAACARHLSALYVLQGRIMEARQVARGALRFEPGRASLRRLAAVSLPVDRARRYLWRDAKPMPTGPHRKPIDFAAPSA